MGKRVGKGVGKRVGKGVGKGDLKYAADADGSGDKAVIRTGVLEEDCTGLELLLLGIRDVDKDVDKAGSGPVIEL